MRQDLGESGFHRLAWFEWDPAGEHERGGAAPAVRCRTMARGKAAGFGTRSNASMRLFRFARSALDSAFSNFRLGHLHHVSGFLDGSFLLLGALLLGGAVCQLGRPPRAGQASLPRDAVDKAIELGDGLARGVGLLVVERHGLFMDGLLPGGGNGMFRRNSAERRRPAAEVIALGDGSNFVIVTASAAKVRLKITVAAVSVMSLSVLRRRWT